MIYNTAYDELVSAGPFLRDRAEADTLFRAAVLESFNYHFQNCAAFANYCKNREIHDLNPNFPLGELPYIPAQAFKKFGRDLLLTPFSDKRSFVMNSSATSGVPSSIVVSRENAKRQAVAMAKVVSAFLGKVKRPFIIFDLDPSENKQTELGARYGATVGYMSMASESYFVLKKDEYGTIVLDFDKLHNAIEKLNKIDVAPVIFGFTYVIFETLAKLNNDKNLANFKIGNILHIGGWKKLEAQKITRNLFNEMVAGKFGLNASDVIDAYGFTEQMGINHFSIGAGAKICPNFARVLVRDPVSLEVLPVGEEGLLQFISPLPLSYPGISVLTDDMGFITSDFGETFGYTGTLFNVTGRAKNAEVRGCGDIMSTYLKRSADQEIKPATIIPKPRVLHFEKNFNNFNLKSNTINIDSLPVMSDIESMAKRLRENAKKLERYSVDDLIAFFSLASKSWMTEQSPLQDLQKHGLSFLVNWLTAENLRLIADKSLKGNRGVLDRFVIDESAPVRSLRALPRGVVGHWLAGNVPLLGMLGLVQAILTKNASLLRVPAINAAVMPLILKDLSEKEILLSNGVLVKGKDITDAVALIYYDKADNDTANRFSLICDVRIAWGGAEAVHAISNLPKKMDCETIVFGPKLSYLAISSDEFITGKNTEKLFRRLSTDCSVFDQYACASPHTVFVERSDYITEIEFCERFADHMEKASKRLPKDNIDAGTAANIISKRFEYDFKGKVWQSSGTNWTIVLQTDNVSLVEPTYSRFVTVIFVDNILSAAELAHADIQTIALAMPYDKKVQFAEIASCRGAVRFPEIGRMTHFEAPWDGVFLMDRLVRFVTMGGPLV